MDTSKPLDTVDNIYTSMINNPLMPMTLRIGLAGHRKLPDDDSEQMQWMRSQLKSIYASIYKISSDLANTPDACSLYQKSSKPVFRLISSLAEGADRLCLQTKLVNFDHQLACILPFSKEEYAKDFSPTNSVSDQTNGTVKEYENLLETADYGKENGQVIELDGDPTQRRQAYRQCGKVLTEHSDILIAAYDRGDSITAEVVQQAQTSGIPVIWISTENQSVTLLPSKNFGHDSESIPFSDNALLKELRRLLLFEDIFYGQRDDTADKVNERKQRIYDRFKRFNGGSLLTKSDSTIDFDNSGPIELNTSNEGLFSNAFSRFKKALAPKTNNTENTKSVRLLDQGPSVHYFYAAYLRADRLANYYSNLHRSTFLLIYLLGAAALILAALSLSFKENETLVLILVSTKLFLLGSIYWLYRRDHHNDYHCRWLEYRFLSESIRPMYYLIQLGKTYSLTNLRDTREYLDRELIGHNRVGRGWLYIYIEILIRHTGFSNCRLTQSSVQDISNLVGQTWIKGQLDYHTNNAAIMQVIGSRLGHFSLALFFATVGIVLFKLLKLILCFKIPYFLIEFFGLATAIFPILATAAFVIRNHAEFDISAQRSLTIKPFLAMQCNRLANAKSDMSSQQLATLLYDTAAVTTKEVADWLEIYEVKEAEPA
ncbi:hypothetical protein KFE80_12950 [bacterium SCSIO 12696]|nr:hypothetical protein KFE80_12950 [bacterium SCSIO 12696]